MRIGLLPLGRPTFDVPYAERKLGAMLARLESTGHELLGPRTLLTGAEDAARALETLRAARPELVLVLQVTFTDAAFVVRAAAELQTRLALWAPREPRVGGRLRLNAFCGLNLASHALGTSGYGFSWLYADPELELPAAEAPTDAPAPSADRVLSSDAAGVDLDAGDPRVASARDLEALLSGERAVSPLDGAPSGAEPLPASPLAGARIVRIGAPPEGFDTCRHDTSDVARRFDARVEEIALAELFELAGDAPPASVAALRARAAGELEGLDELDQPELERSLRLKLALEALRERRDADAFAIRCWPEAFTEYGGAVCGPVSMMGEARTPCACEADVWGALTQLALQRVTDAPVFLVDLVDLDVADDTAVVWHCGQAPLSMAAGDARATLHTNRRMPLLYEFPLRAGRVTFLRLSQARGAPRVVVATGEVLDRPGAFTGTSGVVRFDAPADTVLERVMDSALEHHTALVYGDHADALKRLAASLALSLIELTA